MDSRSSAEGITGLLGVGLLAVGLASATDVIGLALGHVAEVLGGGLLRIGLEGR